MNFRSAPQILLIVRLEFMTTFEESRETDHRLSALGFGRDHATDYHTKRICKWEDKCCKDRGTWQKQANNEATRDPHCQEDNLYKPHFSLSKRGEEKSN